MEVGTSEDNEELDGLLPKVLKYRRNILSVFQFDYFLQN